MSINDKLGTRMKNNYENIPKTKLMRRCPVAIRIDGKAFHTFTRGFEKPFDRILIETMEETMLYLCKNIQGCVFGYTQSDEITLILVDYQTFETAAWFDYEVQKLCSVAASMATMAFNKTFNEKFDYWLSKTNKDLDFWAAYARAVTKGAMFDARCFNIPKEEVCNLIYWRQLDAIRNSVQMVGQANFSSKELEGLSCNQIKEKLIQEKNINWDDLPTECQRGIACFKNYVEVSYGSKIIEEGGWIIDYHMPILKGEDRDYVEKHILI